MPHPRHLIFRLNCDRPSPPSPFLCGWATISYTVWCEHTPYFIANSLCVAIAFGSRVIVVHPIYQPNTSTQLSPRLLPSLQSAKSWPNQIQNCWFRDTCSGSDVVLKMISGETSLNLSSLYVKSLSQPPQGPPIWVVFGRGRSMLRSSGCEMNVISVLSP